MKETIFLKYELYPELGSNGLQVIELQQSDCKKLVHTEKTGDAGWWICMNNESSKYCTMKSCATDVYD